ncbi:MAG: hypothetical protein FRX49_01888 [Trebouxia sp. A1-2]|nr:MAG: hypothetical protein FRX49_01888 [Trebouxia sp. A1-2]
MHGQHPQPYRLLLKQELPEGTIGQGQREFHTAQPGKRARSQDTQEGTARRMEVTYTLEDEGRKCGASSYGAKQRRQRHGTEGCREGGWEGRGPGQREKAREWSEADASAPPFTSPTTLWGAPLTNSSAPFTDLSRAITPDLVSAGSNSNLFRTRKHKGVKLKPVLTHQEASFNSFEGLLVSVVPHKLVPANERERVADSQCLLEAVGPAHGDRLQPRWLYDKHRDLLGLPRWACKPEDPAALPGSICCNEEDAQLEDQRKSTEAKQILHSQAYSAQRGVEEELVRQMQTLADDNVDQLLAHQQEWFLGKTQLIQWSHNLAQHVSHGNKIVTEEAKHSISSSRTSPLQVLHKQQV